MSFTVVIKNNEDGKILFASEKTNALVIGAVAEIDSGGDPAISLACRDSRPSDAALAIGLAREAIESLEKTDPEIKMLSHAVDAFLSMRRKK